MIEGQALSHRCDRELHGYHRDDCGRNGRGETFRIARSGCSIALAEDTALSLEPSNYILDDSLV